VNARFPFLRSLLALALVCLSCTPAPSPAPMPDAGDAGPAMISGCRRACENLATPEVDCPEGKAPNCAEICERAVSVHLVKIDWECLATAHSKAAAKACGAVSCGGP